MALGIHTFYVFPRLYNLISNREHYFVGRYWGDPFNDVTFNERLKRVHQKLQTSFGNNYTYFWSSGISKPYNPLTEKQRYQRAFTKASNIHKKKALKIIQDNTLFINEYLCEEINRFADRVVVLKKRYNQSIS